MDRVHGFVEGWKENWKDVICVSSFYALPMVGTSAKIAEKFFDVNLFTTLGSALRVPYTFLNGSQIFQTQAPLVKPLDTYGEQLEKMGQSRDLLLGAFIIGKIAAIFIFNISLLWLPIYVSLAFIDKNTVTNITEKAKELTATIKGWFQSDPAPAAGAAAQ